MPKPKAPKFGADQRATFISEIRRGTNRLDAAALIEIEYDALADALAEPAFARQVQQAEEYAVRTALLESALTGNIPAIHLFLTRFNQAEPAAPQTLSPAAQELNRLSAPLRSLIGD